MNHNINYKSEFISAISNTLLGGYSISASELKAGDHPFVYPSGMSQKLMLPFNKLFGKSNGRYDLSVIKGRCFEIHAAMSVELYKLLRLPTILTIGYVTKEGVDIFKFDKIENLPTKTTMEGKPSLNYHVWLTLPNHKILDYTFIAHYEYIRCLEFKRALLSNATDFVFNYGNPESIFKNEDSIYHPLYVGADAIKKSVVINTKVEI